jgi:hypothetical protein
MILKLFVWNTWWCIDAHQKPRFGYGDGRGVGVGGPGVGGASTAVAPRGFDLLTTRWSWFLSAVDCDFIGKSRALVPGVTGLASLRPWGVDVELSYHSVASRRHRRACSDPLLMLFGPAWGGLLSFTRDFVVSTIGTRCVLAGSTYRGLKQEGHANILVGARRRCQVVSQGCRDFSVSQ